MPPRIVRLAERAGVKGVTTPLDIANQISKGLAKKTVVAKVRGAAAAGLTAAAPWAWCAAWASWCQALSLSNDLLGGCGACCWVRCPGAHTAATAWLAYIPRLQVDGSTWDLTRPLAGDCALQLLSFDDAEGKEVRPQGAAHRLLLCCCGWACCRWVHWG